MNLKCKNCGKKFSILPGQYRQRKAKFCGQACYHAYRKGISRGRYASGKQEKLCEHCQRAYTARGDRQRFCNRACLYASLRGSTSPSWKGGRIVTVEGYVWAYAPDHPNASGGYVREHRLVMEKILGRLLIKGETVHHISGDKQDNRPENLQLRHKNHGNGVACRCADCGSTNIIFEPVERVRS